MKRKAQELEFISQINRDGSGVTKVNKDTLLYLNTQNEIFNLKSLSMTNGTFIATNFNSFVVKLKEFDKQQIKVALADELVEMMLDVHQRCICYPHDTKSQEQFIMIKNELLAVITPEKNKNHVSN